MIFGKQLSIRLFNLAGLFGFLLIYSTLIKASERVLELDDVSLSIQVTQAENPAKARLLWLPSEYGILPQEKQLAQQLAQHGLESWFVDIYEAMFQAPKSATVDEVPTEWLAQLIAYAKQDQQPLWIVAPNKAAQLAVRGLVEWQQSPQSAVGLLLINPNLYLNTPKPGQEARYWAQASALNLPVSILQAEQSSRRWRVMELAEIMQQGGSDVFVQVQMQVRDRFYFRPDAVDIEEQVTTQLADKMRTMMANQLPYMSELRQVEAPVEHHKNRVENTRSTELQPFEGEQGRGLNLQSVSGENLALTDYKGKVVLLNFWATWCPPCVHEVPSMVRLKEYLSDQPFEILAVNLAESKEAVELFVHQYSVNFPVLLDPASSSVKSWQLFAYPSTYLIDKQGKIRYALFGGTEWDQADHLQKIEALLAEP